MKLLSRRVAPGGNPSPARFDPGRPLAFMHIPKTSGTAIAAGLIALLAPASGVGGCDLSVFGSYRDLDSIDASVRARVYSSPTDLPQAADFVVGHFCLSTLKTAYPGAQHLTLLREPRSRLLSHWLFLRQHTDGDLAVWGGWAKYARRSRQSLADFISDPALACQTDNLTARMLLWPHPLVPEDGFIDPVNDKKLLREAIERLLTFDFIDIVDGGAFVPRLGSWLGNPFHYGWENETKPTPAPFHSPLHSELTADAVDLLEVRSRLDRHLWEKIAARFIPARDVPKLREQAILANVARYGAMIAE